MLRPTVPFFCLLAAVGCGSGTTTTTTFDSSEHPDGLSKLIASRQNQKDAGANTLATTLADAAAEAGMTNSAANNGSDSDNACTADAAAAAGAHGVCLCGSAVTPAQPTSGSGSDHGGGKGGGTCRTPPSIGRHHTLALRSSKDSDKSKNDCAPAQPSCVSVKKWPADPNVDSCPCAPSEAAALDDDVGEATADANVTVLDPNRMGTALTLAAGDYTVPGIKAARSLSITASGAVRLYVQGDVQVHGALALTPTATGSLNVWISGRLSVDGALQAGLSSAPAATRLYVAGNQVSLGKASRLDGQLFAPIAALSAPKGLEVHGSLLAASVQDSSNTQVCYDSAVSAPPFSCAAPMAPAQPTQPTLPPVTTCGACTINCGALACGADLTCVPCDSESKCCSGRVCQAGNCVVSNQ